MLEQLSATIDEIYGAAANASRWPNALASVEQLTGSAGAVVHLIPKSPGAEIKTLLGDSAGGLFLADHVAEWTAHYAPRCPRIAGAERFPEAAFLVDHMLLSEQDMDADPVYDWYGRYGLRYFVGSNLFDSEAVRAVWSLQRTRGQGHAQDEDVRLFLALKPHIARSLSLSLQLGTLRSEHQLSSAILEALPQSVLVLDAHGRVLSANRSARQLLGSGDVAFVDSGILKTHAPSDQARLDKALSGALCPMSARATGSWIRLSRIRGGPPFAVFVAPFKSLDEELNATGARVLVIIHDTADHRCVSIEMLTTVYGLTETEARLASALSGGHSLESAAALLHVQPATARSHLKAVFRKMDVGRQQDLVRALAPIAAAPEQS